MQCVWRKKTNEDKGRVCDPPLLLVLLEVLDTFDGIGMMLEGVIAGVGER